MTTIPDDDDFDADLDELLKGLEMDKDKKETEPTTQPSKSNLKDPTVIKDSKLSENVQNTNSQSKSVRFSHDIPDSTGRLNQKKPSSMLSNMFFPQDDLKNQPKQSQQQDNNRDNPKEEESIRPQSKQQVQKDDWLGLEDDDSLKPSKSYPKIPTEPVKSVPPSPKKSIVNSTKTSGQDIFQRRLSAAAEQFNKEDMLRLLPFESKKTTSLDKEDEEPLSKKPPLPNNSIKNPRMGDTPLVSNQQQLGPSAQFNLGRFTEHSKPINYTGGQQTPNEGGSLSSLTLLLDGSKQIPKQTSTPPSSTLLDALPFLKQRVQGTPSGDGDNNQSQDQQPLIGAVGQGAGKKKTVVSKVTSSVNTNTLQLPSHLVNADELKTMSSSLKTLYGNQLEMLENSYKEQMEFLSLSNKRKEDLLKDELSALQNDYDQRIQRLRTELIDNETRNPQKVNEEISTLLTSFDKLSSQLEILKSSSELQSKKISEINIVEVKSGLSQELERVLENKLSGVAQNIQTSLLREMSQTVETSVSKSISDQSKQFQELKSKLDKVVGETGQNSELVLSKITENEKLQQVKFDELIKVQKKVKDKAVNLALNSVTKTFEGFREEDLRKRDKLAFQVKEFRKDLRRLYVELENKNDSVHKSQLSMELEQRSITQAIRDMNTLLKVTSVKHNANNNSSNDITSQFAAMHAAQQQSQNEMEIKLLREERTSMSASIAELNVERRKLNEEKMNIERDRMELEREKVRIRDIEMKSKVRLSEAHELKRNAESLRLQETKLSSEADSKLQEAAKEKSKMKERFFEMEQKLVIREQKLFQDKSELMREKEFVDKLRDQMLCPGCLNSLKSVSSLIDLTSTPYLKQMRSQGDGVDFGVGLVSRDGSRISNNDEIFRQMPGFNLTLDEDAYFRKESKYLDDFSTKRFSDL